MSLCCWINYWNKLCLCSKVSIVLGVILFLWLIWRIFGRRTVTIHVRDFKKDLVYLFHIPSVETIVSFSPFALKLETWLRLKKVPYESIRGFSKWSKYGQTPFIELNGEHIADSNIIIEELEKKFEKQDDLSPEQRSVSRAFTTMLENQTALSYGYYRYVDDVKKFLKMWTFLNPLQRFIVSRILSWKSKRKVQELGIGRHPKEEMYRFAMQDIQALSDYLGSKSFLMGERITTVDCAAFGHLCQLRFIPLDDPHKAYLEKNCPNLVAYVHRIKEEIWPDWTEVCERHMYDNN